MTGRGQAVRRSASPRSGHGHTATTHLRQERGNDGDGSFRIAEQLFVLARPLLFQRSVDRSKLGVELGAEPVHDGNDGERNAAAINPYLIAVAPDLSALNCLKMVVIDRGIQLRSRLEPRLDFREQRAAPCCDRFASAPAVETASSSGSAVERAHHLSHHSPGNP
jgi:hypothetical protein